MTPAMEHAIRSRAEKARSESRGMPLETDENDREVLLTEVDELRTALSEIRELHSTTLLGMCRACGGVAPCRTSRIAQNGGEQQ